MPTTPMKIPLHDYQIYAKNFVLTHPYCGLFLKMGLGKTSIMLESLYELRPDLLTQPNISVSPNYRHAPHVLIIAPKNIARCTWVNEIQKWNIPFRTQSLVVNERGKQLTKKKRETIYDSIETAEPTVYFINREMFPALVNYFMNQENNKQAKKKPVPGKSPWPFGIIIIDESQSFKSYNSERFRAIKEVRPWTSRISLLTGSPAPNTLEDLWAQIWILDMGQRLGVNITAYRNNYFLPGIIVNNYPVTWKLRKNADKEIFYKISDIVISMKNDHIKLPPLTLNPIKIKLTEDEMNAYKEFMKTQIFEVPDSELTIDASNAAVLSSKLSQMASGTLYTEPKKHIYHVIHEKKLEMCEYIINNTPDNVIIAYHFQSDRDELLRYLPTVGINPVVFDGSPEMERKWNEGQIPVILLQPASCGHGLNLQKGGHTLIWYTLPWSLEHYEQTNARIYRQGQSEPVVIHQLMTENTIDTRILRALRDKDTGQERLIKAVEATIHNKPDEED